MICLFLWVLGLQRDLGNDNAKSIGNNAEARCIITTVAIRDGIIAGDGRVTWDNHISTDKFTKIVATETHLAGISGQADYGLKFLDWVKRGCDDKRVPQNVNKTTGDIDAFIVDAQGIITCYGPDMMPLKLGKLPFYAIGSGHAYAIGAMAMGATAVEAVRIAAKYDSSTGGRIIFRTLKM